MSNVTPLPDTAELLRWLRSRAVLEESLFTQDALIQAADTIERLQKEVTQAKQDGRYVAEREMVIVQERDAAEAEVERLKAETVDRAKLQRALDQLNAGAVEAEL